MWQWWRNPRKGQDYTKSASLDCNNYSTINIWFKSCITSAICSVLTVMAVQFRNVSEYPSHLSKWHLYISGTFYLPQCLISYDADYNHLYLHSTSLTCSLFLFPFPVSLPPYLQSISFIINVPLDLTPVIPNKHSLFHSHFLNTWPKNLTCPLPTHRINCPSAPTLLDNSTFVFQYPH